MKLSILIATVEDRKDQFDRLVEVLLNQCIDFPNEVEIVPHCDNREISIGKKRQGLIDSANGEYVVFIDDDDMVSKDYVPSIMEALQSAPDFVGFQIQCTFDGGAPILADASNKYDDWKNGSGKFKYFRTPYHKTPIRKDIASAIGFKDMRYGEDYDFSKRLKQSGMISTEFYINKVLYFYNFVYQHPSKKYGITK